MQKPSYTEKVKRYKRKKKKNSVRKPLSSYMPPSQQMDRTVSHISSQLYLTSIYTAGWYRRSVRNFKRWVAPVNVEWWTWWYTEVVSLSVQSLNPWQCPYLEPNRVCRNTDWNNQMSGTMECLQCLDVWYLDVWYCRIDHQYNHK